MKISSLIPGGCGPVFKDLFKKHEELETISIGLYCVMSSSSSVMRSREDKKDIVLNIFSNLNLRSIIIRNVWNTGDIIGRLPSALPSLEKLGLIRWCFSSSNQRIIEILNRYGSSLRELDLSDSDITGVGVNSLPNLVVLKLHWCNNLTDGGLKEFLRLSGNKLRVLDVSCTRITGQGFKEGVSLPMLEELDMRGCEQLTDSGLLEILSISGSRLKTVTCM